MGLEITADETMPIPRNTMLHLCCDGADHGMFPIHAWFDSPDGFVGAYRKAMTNGWKDTHDARGNRLILGPCCSGKVAA